MPLREREDELVGIEGLHGGPPSYGDDGADAIVVGGGPAGAVTALLLARAGRRVVVVERQTFPRAKPCGDCLSAGATDLLRQLGLLERVLASGAARLPGWTIVAPAGHACRGDFDDGALALERRTLDNLLLAAARQAGARVIQGRVTGLLRGSGSGAGRDRVRGVRVARTPAPELLLRAPLVVGADGLRSVVARRLGAIRRRPRLRKLSLTTHGQGLAEPLERGEMHVLDDGCIGLAPAGRGRFNLTIVVGESRAARLREVGAEDFLAECVDRAPGVRERVRVAELERPFLASGPFDWATRATTGPGVALVGDAAGYYDPFTGQGVYQAMEGARLLAAALADTPLDRQPAVDAALRRYRRDLRRLKRPARRVQWLIELALARPRRADRVLRWLGGAPVAMHRLLEVTGDLRPARALFSPRVLSSLVFSPGPEVP